MERNKVTPQIGKRYILRCGLKTRKVRLSNDGTNYIMEAIVESVKGNYVLSWLKDGSYLKSGIQNRFDIVEELTKTTKQ